MDEGTTLKTLHINKEKLYSLCKEKTTGDYYLEVVVGHSFVTYSLYCLITEEEYNAYEVNQEAMNNLVDYIRNTKREEVEQNRVIKQYKDFCITEKKKVTRKKKSEKNQKVQKEDPEKVYKLIESWEADEIKKAINIIKHDEQLKTLVEERYSNIYRHVLKRETLRSLANLPTKWDKLKNKDKTLLIEYWPEGCPFFTDVIQMNGTHKVDSYRYSTYFNQIDALPDNIGRLKNVKELHLENQQLEVLPESIGEMSSLEVFNLKNNELERLPDSFEDLKALKVLNLELNYGFKQALSVGENKNLEEINLTYTGINEIDDSFYELNCIKKIVTENSDLDRNTDIIKKLIEYFPDAEIVSGAKEAIEIENNTDGDEYIGVESITIDDFKLNHLPKALFKADKVKKLKLGCPYLQEIPEEISNLQTLEDLYFADFCCDFPFPEAITKLNNLRVLKMNGGFKAEHKIIPMGLRNLKNLKELNLKNYDAESFNRVLPHLSSLENLTLNDIDVVEMTSNWSKLVNLQTLCIEKVDRMEDDLKIHPSLMILSNLKEVRIEMNGGKITEDIFNLPRNIEELTLEVDLWSSDLEVRSELALDKLLAHFKNLNMLELKNIKLTDAGVKVPSGHPLKRLMLDGPYSRLPESIGNLKAMTNLRVFNRTYSDHIGLEHWTKELYECSNLEKIRISKVAMETIPAGISRLQRLESLCFEDGDISALPEDIYELNNLKVLVLDDCPLFKDKSFKQKIKREIKGIKVKKSLW